MRNALDRFGDRGPRAADAVLAGLLVAAFGVEVAVYYDGSAASVLLSVPVALAIGALTLRRQVPALMLAGLVLACLPAELIEPDFFQKLTTPYLALMIALYSVGRYERRRHFGAWTCVAALAVVSLNVIVTDDLEQPTQLLWLVLLGGGPYMVGRAMRNRVRLQAELRVRTEQLALEGERMAERAVEDERVRIAGELQAVVANGVSAMVVQAEAVPRVIADFKPAKAEAALAVIEETGRDTLGEMRRLLGVLRRDEDGPELAPQPTLAEADRLADRVRAGGVEVAMRVEGERRDLTAGADLAAYRVLQQALESAAKDGASSADVSIAFGEGELRIDVSDDRDGQGSDRNTLRAMRERLGLYGGRVRVDAGNGARHRVVARLPLDGGAR